MACLAFTPRAGGGGGQAGPPRLAPAHAPRNPGSRRRTCQRRTPVTWPSLTTAGRQRLWALSSLYRCCAAHDLADMSKPATSGL